MTNGLNEEDQPRTRNLSTRISAEEQSQLAVEAALEKKGVRPVLLDVSKTSSYTDYLLLVSGRSDRHVQSLADGLVEAFAAEGIRPIGIEGQKTGQWTLIDFGDVIVHVFYHPLREFYDLEGLWHDAPRVELTVPAESQEEPQY